MKKNITKKDVFSNLIFVLLIISLLLLIFDFKYPAIVSQTILVIGFIGMSLLEVKKEEWIKKSWTDKLISPILPISIIIIAYVMIVKDFICK